MSHLDNLAALVHFRGKAHKWKNVALLLAVFSFMLTLKCIFGSGLSDGIVEGDYVASIKIEGVIFEDDFRSEVLNKIAEEKSIKAVIVNIDSPGGGIVGSEILFNDLRAIAQAKPTVVLMGATAASGAYMAAVASDYIVAHNGTLTGSIGVLMESPEVVDLANKIGVKLNTYKSSPLKGSPSPFEKTSVAAERVLQDSISDSHKFFSDLVMQRRGQKINPSFKNVVFDGRIFTGRQAVQAGLIDGVGGKAEALSYLSQNKIDLKKLPIKEVEITEHEKKFFEKFFGMLPFLNGKNGGANKGMMAVF